MSDSEADPSFSVLPARLRRRVDRAFDNTLIEAGHSERAGEPGPSRKRLKVDTSVSTGGGFISSGPGGSISDSPPQLTGGFLVDDTTPGGFIAEVEGGRTSESSEDEDAPARFTHNYIPLTLVPTALQLLDLQPDDPDVLAVFESAASGWEGGRRGENRSPSELRVSRKDWHAVCVALLDTSGDDDEDRKSARDQSHEDEEVGESAALKENDEFDEYIDYESQSEEDDDDDEYREGGFVRTKSGASPKSGKRPMRMPSSDPENDSDDARLKHTTPRQKAECRRTFSLFFPDVPDDSLNGQRIMIKDIARVAALLKEKITAEEIIEMLEAFSTSPDKSMNLADFEIMMIATKMV